MVPIALEVGGRLGNEGVQGLEVLAEAVAGAAPYLTRRGLVVRWRRRIEAALAFATADLLLLAAAGPTVRGPHDVPPAQEGPETGDGDAAP